MSKHSFWHVTLNGILGKKHIFFISLEDRIKHVYTLCNKAPELSKNRPVHYHETLRSTIRRLKVKRYPYERLSGDAALKCVLDHAVRDDVILTAMNHIRYYEKGG